MENIINQNALRRRNQPPEPHPIDPIISFAAGVITSSYQKAISLRKDLTGEYDEYQDFSSRLNWTQHHIEILHKSTSQPSFWIEWSFINKEVYLQVKGEMYTLCQQQERASRISDRINARQQPIQGRTATNKYKKIEELANYKFTLLGEKLVAIASRISLLNGESYLAEKHGDFLAIRDAIAELETLPEEVSWDGWLLKHEKTCRDLQSRIDSLNHCAYLYVSDEQPHINIADLPDTRKLPGIRVGDLKSLFHRALYKSALKHYIGPATREYTSLYKEIEEELALLQTSKSAYHSTWGNYVWSHWEAEHSTKKYRLDMRLHSLKCLYETYTDTIRHQGGPELLPYRTLQRLYLSLFPSQKGQGADRPFFGSYWPAFPFPKGWEQSQHFGVPIKSNALQVSSALQLVFSNPILAKYVVNGAGQTEGLQQFHEDYLKTNWSIQWNALQGMSQTQTRGSAPEKPYDQFLNHYKHLRLQSPSILHLSRGLFLSLQSIGFEKSQSSIEVLKSLLSPLDREKSPIFYPFITKTTTEDGIQSAQIKQGILQLDFHTKESQDTLESLIAKQFNISNPEQGIVEKRFVNPPEILLIHLNRNEETETSHIGVQEKLFILDAHTENRKGASYELVSFTAASNTAPVYYRKSDFGYTRMQGTRVEEISSTEFLFAAQISSTCVFRRLQGMSTNALIQGATKNQLLFYTTQYKMLATQAIYGQGNFEIPRGAREEFKRLLAFIKHVAISKSYPRIATDYAFEKNPNEALEKSFTELSPALRHFLWQVWKKGESENIQPFLLRDLRQDLLSGGAESALSIPNQEKYDQDGFVLTLMADLLVKHFEEHAPKILKSDEDFFLYQGALQAISNIAKAKRKRAIKHSAMIEESIQMAVTIALSNHLAKGEEFVVRQAVMSSGRLVTVFVDPLQEIAVFQKVSQLSTAILLLGESLDHTELSEQAKNNLLKQFYGRQFFAIVPTGNLSQNQKEFLVASFSTIVFQSPSHLVNWGVSSTFDILNHALQEGIPPDLPQSPFSFWTARTCNALSTNIALQTYTADKITNLATYLIELSPPVQPNIEIEVDPVIQDRSHLMETPPPDITIYFSWDKDDKNDYRIYLYHEGYTPKQVGRFDSQDKAIAATQELNDYIRQLNAQNAAAYNLQKMGELLGLNPNDLPATLNFEPIYVSIDAPGDKSKVKVYLGGKRILKTDSNTAANNKFKDLLSGNIAANAEALATYKSTIDAKAPSYILPPQWHINGPINTSDGNYHYLSYIDKSGKTHSLGKYDTAEAAQLVSGGWSHFEVISADLENQCYQAQQQVANQDVPIERIPERPTLEIPILDGKNSDTNYQKIQGARVRNIKTVTAYLEHLGKLSDTPLNIQSLSKVEINRMTQDLMLKIKDPKEHGFWYNAWRAPGKGLRWLDDHGVSLSVNVQITRDLYKTPPPNSTPSRPGVYGLSEPLQSASVNASVQGPSIVHNWGWQNVEAMQQDTVMKTLEQNINANRQTFSGMPQSPIDYQSMQSPGMASTAQLPPTDFSGLGRNDIVDLRPSNDTLLQMAGLLPFIVSKVVPEQTKIKVETWVKNYIQQWKDDPLQARKDLDICLILGAKKGVVVAIQAFEQPSLKGRPNTFGFWEVSDRFDNWFAQKVNIDLTSPNAQLGMFVGEFAMPLPMMGAFKNCTKVGQEAFAFMRQSAKFMKPNPLIDRTLAFPQGFGKQVRAIEALQQPVYRSGFAGEKAIQQARKAVNMPSWRKIEIDVKHAVSGHMSGGWRTGCKNHNKTLFPEGFSESQVEKAIRHAYKNCKKTQTQEKTIVVIGEYEGIKIKMYVDLKKKKIKTAFPIK